MSDDDDIVETIIERAVESANELNQMSRGEINLIGHAVQGSDVVIAVWPNKDTRYGVGWRLVKGRQRLRDCATDKVGFTLSGVPCADQEQADEWVRIAGEMDRLN
jgi:hypothetical protein